MTTALSISPSGEDLFSDTIPPSPTLTQTSSTSNAIGTDPLEEFLDLDFVASDSTAVTPPPISGIMEPFLANNDTTAMLNAMANPNDQVNLAELFRLYFEGNAKSFTEDAALPPAGYLDYPFAPVVDPALVSATLATMAPDIPMVTVPKIEEEEDTEMYNGDDDEVIVVEDAVEEEEEEEEAEEEEVPAKKTRRPSTRGSRKESTGKAKSVSALEIPNSERNTAVGSSQLTNKLPHIVFPVPDYVDRPNPDEYKKMTSKEKRQLRNKISARNFRHRRKEYIGALEEVIAQRDTTIGVLREEIGALKVENTDLKRDVDFLKEQFEKVMAATALVAAPVPTPPTTASVASTSSPSTTSPTTTNVTSPSVEANHVGPTQEELLAAATAAARRQRSTIPKPNLSKDVNPLSVGWGPGGAGSFGRDLSVHHTILPDRFGQGLDGKPSQPLAERNMNPLLDRLAPNQVSPYTSHLRSLGSNFGVHDAFLATNPYAMRGAAVEEYRGQLYTKLANNVTVAQKSNQTNPPPAGLKLAFFTQPPPPSSLSSVLAGKVPNNNASTSPPPTPTALETAQVASIASSTLISKMANAFIDAFAGPAPSRDLDPRKVSDVLAGRSRVEVVPKEDVSTELLNSRLGQLSLSPLPSPTAQANCISSILFGRKSSTPPPPSS